MTIKQRIVLFLKDHPEGIDDDELSNFLKLNSRQHANMECRKLAKMGLIERRKTNGKIHNYLSEKPIIPSPALILKAQTDFPSHELWFWEGNVQLKIVNYLESKNYQIVSVADTASHQRGKDIIAERDGELLWVSVKGYPKGTNKTHPSTQAGIWFRDVIFDMIKYREVDKHVSLVVALPDFPRYRSLVKSISWFQSTAKYLYFWVNENGEITPS
jgi:hypothetical protein